MRKLLCVFITSIGLLTSFDAAFPISNPAEYTRMVEATKNQASNKIKSTLKQYCGEFCQLINIDVTVDEQIPDGEDMGFESTVPAGSGATLTITDLKATIQIDERVGSVNRTRLSDILNIHLNTLAMKPEIIWRPVKLPHITRYAEGEPGYLLDGVSDSDYKEGEWDFRPQDYSGKAQKLRSKLNRQVTSVLNKIVAKYCPNQCIVERIDILGGIISPKEAMKLGSNQQIRGSSGRLIFKIDNVDIDITMDSKLTPTEREKITGVMRSKLRFINPVNLNIGAIEFPDSYAEIEARKRQSESDPYGLEKLRRMLMMFRDLAGTKEVITTNTSASEKTSQDTEMTQTKDQINASSSSSAIELDEIMAYIGALILLLGLVAYLLVKARQSKRDALDMMITSQNAQNTQNNTDMDGENFEEKPSNDKKEELSLQIKCQDIKDELIDLFIQNPKVAKETFSRFLKEDGVEDTAKYVHVFGHLIVFELLKDPNFQRELYELSEYYHNSDFEFELAKEYDLLLKLKTRVTASEIRVLTQKSSEKFEFLSKLDPSQVFQLIKGEKIHVQAIVLTQLERKKRQSVFDLYVGDSKVELMNELSAAETIPKEFLYNVATALGKKVSAKPEFDTENLRTSDILLDLLEKAPLEEQKKLMSTLQTNNADTARSIKARLVTVHILPYLKDGHLLELTLGMDREDLLIFLTSTHEGLRDLLLRKAPEELSDSWVEDMATMAMPDEQTYRLVEMKVINKIRNLAANGTVSLVEINDMIFEEIPADFDVQDEELAPLNDSFSAA